MKFCTVLNEKIGLIGYHAYFLYHIMCQSNAYNVENVLAYGELMYFLCAYFIEAHIRIYNKLQF